MSYLEELTNISHIPVSYCVAIVDPDNDTSRSYKFKPTGFNNHENLRNKPDQQFMAFLYTCVILGYFSFFIMLLMMTGLYEDKKNKDCKIAEILENIRKANEVEVNVREKRKLQVAKQKAKGYVDTWNNRPKRSLPTTNLAQHSRLLRSQSCIPTIIVIEASPPTKATILKEKECFSESTTDEESVCSSNSSVISFQM